MSTKKTEDPSIKDTGLWTKTSAAVETSIVATSGAAGIAAAVAATSGAIFGVTAAPVGAVVGLLLASAIAATAMFSSNKNKSELLDNDGEEDF
ncbi:MAG: hypothetical protein SAK29_29385 [Scytonema sp. PMC 1069.18]|nr:hypothetical protein [Scytonema sp. PMC 1069.18]MEC4886803.1 hypothetical protein [Scytonema sp. PMC 1070.18]